MKTILIQISLFLIIFCQIFLAKAGELETDIGNIAIEAIKTSLINSTMREQVNRMFPTTAAATASAGQASLTNGDLTLAGIGIALGVYEYGHAKNDKQRFYAAAEVSASGLMIANPPAGVVAAITVSVIKLTDNLFTYRSAAEIAQIRAHAVAIYNQIIEMKNQQAEKERQYINSYFKIIEQYHTQAKEFEKESNQTCKQLEKDNTNLKLLHNCIELNNKYLLKLQILTALIESVDLDTRRFEIRKISQVNHAINEVSKNIKVYKNTINNFNLKLNQLQESYNMLFADQFYLDLHKKFNISQIETHTEKCGLLLSKLTMKMALITSNFPNYLKLKQQQKNFKHLELNLIYQSIKQVKSSYCYTINSEAFNDLYSSAGITLDNYLEDKQEFEEALNLFNKKLSAGDWRE